MKMSPVNITECKLINITSDGYIYCGLKAKVLDLEDSKLRYDSEL